MASELFPCADWIELIDIGSNKDAAKPDSKKKKSKTSFIRKKEIYKMRWDLNISETILVAAPFGGPIAATIRLSLLEFDTDEDSKIKTDVTIYNPAGAKIAFIPWKEKQNIVTMGWTSDECLICLTSDGNVYTYDSHGSPLLNRLFSFESKLKKGDKIEKAKIWQYGVAIITSRRELYVVNDILRPQILHYQKFSEIAGRVGAWEVIPAEPPLNSEFLVSISNKGKESLISVTAESVADLEVNTGQLTHLVLSATGQHVAYFSHDGEKGTLTCVSSEFYQTHLEMDIPCAAPPSQLIWYGDDHVLMNWDSAELRGPDAANDGTSFILVTNLSAEINKISYFGSVYLSAETDHVRVFTNYYFDIVERVSSAAVDIFRIGSMEPAAKLYDSYLEYEQRKSTSIKMVRELQNENKLQEAVKQCLEAAKCEWNKDIQTSLLMAASYGKTYHTDINADDFVDLCRSLRVLNSLRHHEFAVPLTYNQFATLGPHAVIDRLLSRNLHFLAYQISKHLDIKPDKILTHWACSKILSNEKDVAQDIIKKLRTVPGLSYVDIASTAYRVNKPDLAIELLARETNISEQVPLLLSMRETEQALRRSVDSGEADLVYLVLLHMKEKMEPQRVGEAIFDNIERTPPGSITRDMSRRLLATYCRHRDPNYLKTFVRECMPEDCPRWYITLMAADLHSKSPEDQARALQDTYVTLADRGYKADAQLTEEQQQLCDVHDEMGLNEEQHGVLSIADTIYLYVVSGNDSKAEKLKNKFKITEKKWWWIKIRGLAARKDWVGLQKFARSKKKSPIGYKPFVEVCMQADEPERSNETKKYIAMLNDPWEEIEAYMAISAFKEALEVAYAERSIVMIEHISKKTTNPRTKITIQRLIKELSGGVPE